MTRAQKTIRNFAVAAAVCAAWLWLNGGYFTPEAVVMESMEQLGFAPCEIIREIELPSGKREYILRSEQGTYAIHGARRALLLWYTSGGGTGMDLDARDEDLPFTHSWGSGGAGQGREPDVYLYCMRRDPRIARVVWSNEELTFESDIWINDIAVVTYAGDHEGYDVRVYDENGTLLAEDLRR